MEKTVTEAIHYRRSVRIYKDVPIDTEKVKQCLLNASLAPTSSNLQLWEFYHITSKNILKRIAKACFDQNAAKTAQQLVVIVARKDLWRKRTKANINFINQQYDKQELEPRIVKRKKMILNYYRKLIPFAYFDIFGIFGILKYIMIQLIGLF